jgi:hypothetical protein
MIPFKEYSGFIDEVLTVMNPLKCYRIPVDSTTVSFGYTWKYKGGAPVKSFCVKAKYQAPSQYFLYQVQPDLAWRGVHSLRTSQGSLGTVCPKPSLSIWITSQFHILLIGGSFSMVVWGFCCNCHCD